MNKLSKELDGALLIKHDKKNGLTLAWFGGFYILAYNDKGVNVSCWYMGGTVDTQKAVLTDAEKSMDTHIKDQYYP